MSSDKSFESKDLLVKYAIDHSLRLHPVQAELMKETLKVPQHGMMGAPEVTQLLMNLCKYGKAKKVIEIGVFTGFTTLGLALSIPDDGKITACDISEKFMNIGKPFWKKAGVDRKIIVKIKPALETLDELITNGEKETFDLAFIDADKENYDNYFEKSLQLVKKGGVIAIDNVNQVLWDREVLKENSKKHGTSQIKALNDKLKDDQRIDINLLTIGDGLTLAFKR